MNNNENPSILELLEEHYNTKDGEESKFSWDYLHKRAQELLTEDKRLTDKAKAEAEQHSFDADMYKQILLYLTNSHYTRLEAQISQAYKGGKFDLEKLLEDKNINRLASAYKDHKGGIPIEKLLLLNPAGELEEGFQSKTTFVHKLFENNASKEDILYFFGELNKVSQKNPDLIQNYLALSDESGTSITTILEERSLDGKYANIFSDIKRLYPRLYRAQNNNAIGVDTHTGSVHGSVDESLAKLVKFYAPTSIIRIDNERVVDINRNEAWKEKIRNDILELEQGLQSLTTSEDALKELIDKAKSTGENIEELSSKFKFQAEAALRMVQGLKEGGYGNHYRVDANKPVTCGLSPKEIVAIAYASLNNRELWNNPDQHDQQFMYFVENLYISKRGYNIDRNGENEWRTHGTEQDDNKCTGGTINQIAYGLSDNKLVSVEIKNADTMLAILFQRLKGDVLKNIYEKEDNKNLIVNWLKGELLSNNLRDEILNRLKNDEEFKREFSESEINILAPQALNKLSKSQLEEIKNKSFSEIFSNEAYQSSFDPSKIDKFAFDEEEGYVLALEKCYNTNQEEFFNTINRMLRADINQIDLNSAGARKTNGIINLLLASGNEGMKAGVQGILQEHLKGFSQDQKDQYLVLMAQTDNGYILTPLIQSGANVEATDKRLGHCKRNGLMYAAENNNIEAIKVLINAGADIHAKDHKGDTALHRAVRLNSVEAISELIKLGADINAKDNDGRTALHNAAESSSVESISELIKLGADINAQDNEGNAAVHKAAASNSVEAIRELIKLGADIDAQDNEGNTAVHKAAASNRVEAIRELIKLGADINITDIYGITPLDHAVVSNRIELITEIMSAGAAIKADNYGRTPLHLTVLSGNTDAMKNLINAGADIHGKRNYDGMTALHLATEEGDINLIKMLMSAGADIYDKDNKGRTPLNIALNSRNTEAANILRGYLSLPDFKTKIMSSLNRISRDVSNLSRKISALDKDVQLELVKQLKPEIMNLASSNLGHNVSKIISYFPEGLRFEYFKDVVIDSMKKMNIGETQKMIQPFKAEEKIELYNTWSKYKKENTHVARVEEGKQVSPDDIEITTR